MTKTDSVAVLRELYRAYVNLLESGRDRIRDLGGQCDPVDVMERNDPALIRAREAIAALSAQGECRLHPRYKAVHPPRSTKPDCTCQQVYDAKHPATPGSDAVTEEMVDAAEEAYADAIERENEAERLPLMGRMRVALHEAIDAALAARTGKGEANG